MRLFRGLWRVITMAKNATGNILFLTLVIVILAAAFTSDVVRIDDGVALLLDPAGTIVEQHSTINPLNELMSGYTRNIEVLLRDLLAAISTARTDERIAAMVLDLSGLQGVTMGNLEEIGLALTDFKSSGKRVYAFAPNYSQPQYFIAAHADRVLLDRDSFETFGGVFLTGLGIYPTYFKSALDQLKVDVRVFIAGEYKDAADAYMQDHMSAQSKQANLSWLGDLWQQYGSTIVRERGITGASFEAYINSYGALLVEADNDAARLAVEQGLVDALLTKSEWLDEIQKVVGSSGENYRHVSFLDYLRATRPAVDVPGPGADRVAVITASGTILDGSQPVGTIGSDSISKLIRNARKDARVKALVIRIDSPGGSATASEKIRHELELTQDTGKPVVISMSSYAASGGYWVASTANKIYALESTVTGSIGTFMLFPTFEQSLAHLGIHSDGVGTTELSGAFNPFKSIRPMLKDTLESMVDHTYSRFLSLVARGRDISLADADKIAQGRVWAGKTALGLGLVDAIGGLNDAIRSAAHLADVADYDVIYLEQELSPRERIVNELLNTSVRALSGWHDGHSQFRAWSRLLPDHVLDLAQMSETPGLYVQCLYCNVQ